MFRSLKTLFTKNKHNSKNNATDGGQQPTAAVVRPATAPTPKAPVKAVPKAAAPVTTAPKAPAPVKATPKTAAAAATAKAPTKVAGKKAAATPTAVAPHARFTEQKTKPGVHTLADGSLYVGTFQLQHGSDSQQQWPDEGEAVYPDGSVLTGKWNSVDGQFVKGTMHETSLSRTSEGTFSRLPASRVNPREPRVWLSDGKVTWKNQPTTEGVYQLRVKDEKILGSHSVLQRGVILRPSGEKLEGVFTERGHCTEGIATLNSGVFAGKWTYIDGIPCLEEGSVMQRTYHYRGKLWVRCSFPEPSVRRFYCGELITNPRKDAKPTAKPRSATGLWATGPDGNCYLSVGRRENDNAELCRAEGVFCIEDVARVIQEKELRSVLKYGSSLTVCSSTGKKTFKWGMMGSTNNPSQGLVQHVYDDEKGVWVRDPTGSVAPRTITLPTSRLPMAHTWHYVYHIDEQQTIEEEDNVDTDADGTNDNSTKAQRSKHRHRYRSLSTDDERGLESAYLVGKQSVKLKELGLVVFLPRSLDRDKYVPLPDSSAFKHKHPIVDETTNETFSLVGLRRSLRRVADIIGEEEQQKSTSGDVETALTVQLPCRQWRLTYQNIISREIDWSGDQSNYRDVSGALTPRHEDTLDKMLFEDPETSGRCVLDDLGEVEDLFSIPRVLFDKETTRVGLSFAYPSIVEIATNDQWVLTCLNKWICSDCSSQQLQISEVVPVPAGLERLAYKELRNRLMCIGFHHGALAIVSRRSEPLVPSADDAADVLPEIIDYLTASGTSVSGDEDDVDDENIAYVRFIGTRVDMAMSAYDTMCLISNALKIRPPEWWRQTTTNASQTVAGDPNDASQYLFDVPVGSLEFKLAQRNFPGHTQAITRVQRIQNFALYEKYVKHRREIALENGGDANEKRFMLHGTRATAPDTIIVNGFDPRYSEAGMFGRAAYFAYDVAYSHSYRYNVPTSSTPKLGQLFLVAVARGNIDHREKPDRAIRHPRAGCHCIAGPVTAKCDAVMTYELHQAYPAYLVTYKVW